MNVSFQQQRQKIHQKVVRRIAEMVSTMTAFVVIFSFLITLSNWPAYSLILQDLIDPQAMANQSIMRDEVLDPNIQVQATAEMDKSHVFVLQNSHQHDQSFSLGDLGDLYPSEMRLEVPKVFQDSVPVKNVGIQDFHFEDLYSSENVIQEALRGGVVHYPYTANPDQFGNVFITGHSSYYSWDKGRYKDIFALLHKMTVGDEYFITFKSKKYRYQVTEIFEIRPNDVSVLAQPVDQKISTLMTCAPVGTTLRRLIVRAQQIGVDENSSDGSL
jgi:LPXTG-site transpeptidase (sortase) family protein